MMNIFDYGPPEWQHFIKIRLVLELVLVFPNGQPLAFSQWLAFKDLDTSFKLVYNQANSLKDHGIASKKIALFVS